MTSGKELRDRAQSGNPDAIVELARSLHSGRNGFAEDRVEAALWLRKGVALGDSNATFLLAVYNRDGFGDVARNPAEAERLLREASGKGHVEAKVVLAELLASKPGRDESEIDALLRQASEQGSNRAAVNLASRVQERDPAEAARLYREAADRGDSNAQYNFAVCLHGGKGVVKDVPKACEFLSMAVAAGNASALFMLASLKSSGSDGIEVDEEESDRLMEQAAAAGHPGALFSRATKLLESGEVAEGVAVMNSAAEKGSGDAMFKLATLYLDDSEEAVRRSTRTAIDLLRRASKIGVPEAMFLLAQELAAGKEDTEEVVGLLRQAAGRGHVEAQWKLGEILVEDGRSAEAVQFLRSAAESGSDDAQQLLAQCYANGRGVEPDIGEAIRLWRMAASQGNGAAILNLGMCHYHGRGMPKNLVQAFQHFGAASKIESPTQKDAIFMLGVSHEQGFGTPRFPPLAVVCYEIAAEKGQPDACFNLGTCLWQGNGAPEDKPRALRYWEVAADLGQAGAAQNITQCKLHGVHIDKSNDFPLPVRCAPPPTNKKLRDTAGLAHILDENEMKPRRL